MTLIDFLSLADTTTASWVDGGFRGVFGLIAQSTETLPASAPETSGGAVGGMSGGTSGGVSGGVSGGRPLWQVLLDNGLALSILFIFLTAIISLVVNQRRKDKCLKLMDDYHVSVINQKGAVVWGDLRVFAQGVEVLFDAPYRTRRGLYKTSALIHDAQIKEIAAICRPVEALTPREKALRLRQIRRSFKPGVVRRSLRAGRNLLNTLKDAFAKAMTLLIGQMMKTGAKGTSVAKQEKSVSQIGTDLLGAAGNAYEPILERRIGKPVVLQLTCRHGDKTELIDLPGYLVDYTANYIAVFNVDHETVSHEVLTITGACAGKGWDLQVDGPKARITCTGPELLILKSLKTDQRSVALEVAVPFGASVEFGTDDSAAAELVIERTRRVDIVAPRTVANVYFGGEFAHKLTDTERAAGIAPEQIVEDQSDDPVPGDPLPPPAPAPGNFPRTTDPGS